MKKLLLAFALSLAAKTLFALPGDTTWVQAHAGRQLNNYGAFDTAVSFPSGNASYRKVILQFTLGTYNCPAGSQYCHQWDYDVHNILMTPNGDTIELSRFITPYANTGVWRFPAGWTHRYEFDVTDYYPLLRGTNTFRIFYSGYSYGFTADVKFAFVEGTPERPVVGVSKLWSVNRAYGNAANPISNYLTPQTRTAPPGTQSAEMKVLVTGHGSDANGCCEFDSHNYTAKVNGNAIATVPVWRADCGWNDIYPQGGTWIYDRANWCPGDVVHPFRHTLTGVTGGSTYTAEMNFDAYTSAGNYGSYNVQANAIYYGAVSNTKDVAMEAIYSPNNYEGYVRSNPSNGKPRIKVRNSGSTAVTSMQIVYGVKDSAQLTYNWTGNLPSLTSDTLELPELPALKNLSLNGASGQYVFQSRIAAVNGSADNNAENDTLKSTFAVTPKWPSRIVVQLRTNNEGVGGLNQNPSETGWEIRDINGNVIASRRNANVSSTYADTVDIGTAGLYTLNVTDTGCDGVNWWVFPQVGITSGYLRVRNAANGALINLNAMPNSGTYAGDFGCGFTEAFSVAGWPMGVNQSYGTGVQLKTYPNPANTSTRVILEGMPQVKGVLELTDMAGRTVLIQKAMNATTELNTAPLAAGVYNLRFSDENGRQLTGRLSIVK